VFKKCISKTQVWHVYKYLSTKYVIYLKLV
jgi:hypothetical protein